MKTLRKYDIENDRENAVKQAVQDCKDYINDHTAWIKIVEYIESCSEEEQVHQGLGMFIGIEGFPCTALWETYRSQP